jgi:hypothetical protein
VSAAKGNPVDPVADLTNFRQTGYFNFWLGIAPDDSTERWSLDRM